MDKEFDIDEEGENAAVERAALRKNLEARNRVRAQEIVNTDEEPLNPGNRLLEAKTKENSLHSIRFTK